MTGVEPFPRLDLSHVDELQALFERCSEFFLLTEGAAPHATHAAEELALRAPGKTADDTFCFGVFRGERLVGFIHVTRDFPKPDEWFLGLLVLDPAVRGQGLGVAVHDALRDWIAGHGAHVLWLGVLTQNEPAERFWRARGYLERERKLYTPPSGFMSTMILMSLPLH